MNQRVLPGCRKCAVRAQKHAKGDAVEVQMLGWVGRAAKHVKHALGNPKAASNVDSRDKHGGGRQTLCGCRGQDAATQKQ